MKSKFFTYSELISSQTAENQSIDNRPVQFNYVYNLGKLSVTLDQFRNYIDCPVYVNSGYRCPELNEAVDGAKNSNHLKGLAADITTRSWSVDKKLYEYIKANKSFYNINEVIFYGTFIHISIY